MNSDPIFEHTVGSIFEDGLEDTPGWYFWDENWQQPHGPFPTIQDAQIALQLYAEKL